MEGFLKRDNLKMNYLKAFVFFSPFLFGGYHIWTSAVFSLLLFIYVLLFGFSDKGRIKEKLSLTFLSLALIPLAYLVVSLWAVDSGTAVYGFAKFLPVALFAFILIPLSKDEKAELIDVIPYSAVAMGIVSYALSFMPLFSEQFLVASRLGGFFQYPNSFACFCLTGIPIVLLKEKLTYKNWIVAILLVGIIFLTGSRTVFLLLLAVSAFLLFRMQSKNRIRLAVLLSGAVAVSMIVVLVTDNLQTIGRYLTISLESSTLLGRLLYYRDALPVILKHPFGLGYYGYYFSQGAFQSGVYSVAFIHNDLLQLFLDIGWIPTLLFVFVVVRSFLSENNGVAEKTIMSIICAHSLFDFDLQFISVFLVLVLTLDFETHQLITVKITNRVTVIILTVVIAVSSYFGAINSLFFMKKYDTVNKIYGNDTQSQIFLMTDEDDYEIINSYADSIISRNRYVSVAYSAKANYALKNGDIKSFIDYKENAIGCALYSIDEYNDYCGKLLMALNMYLKAGDRESAVFCAEKVSGIEDMLAEVRDNTDSLAWKIKDKPELELKEEYAEYIKEYRNEK